jgi:hypothetical protein
MKITIVVDDQSASQVDVQGTAPLAAPPTAAVDAGAAPVAPTAPGIGSTTSDTPAIDAGPAPVESDAGSDVLTTASDTSSPSSNGAPISAGPAPTN